MRKHSRSLILLLVFFWQIDLSGFLHVSQLFCKASSWHRRCEVQRFANIILRPIRDQQLLNIPLEQEVDIFRWISMNNISKRSKSLFSSIKIESLSYNLPRRTVVDNTFHQGQQASLDSPSLASRNSYTCYTTEASPLKSNRSAPASYSRTKSSREHVSREHELS